jgi:hypothetical protein
MIGSDANLILRTFKKGESRVARCRRSAAQFLMPLTYAVAATGALLNEVTASITKSATFCGCESMGK